MDREVNELTEKNKNRKSSLTYLKREMLDRKTNRVAKKVFRDYEGDYNPFIEAANYDKRKLQFDNTFREKIKEVDDIYSRMPAEVMNEMYDKTYRVYLDYKKQTSDDMSFEDYLSSITGGDLFDFNEETLHKFFFL